MRTALALASAIAFATAPGLVFAKGDTATKDKGKEKTTTLTGCLSQGTTGTTGTTGATGAEGSYTLKTKAKEVDVRGAQLAEHVGHEVKLTGHWMDDASHAGGTASTTSTTEKQQTKTDKGTKGEGRHFMVTDIQHVSDTCRSAPGASSPKESSPQKKSY